MVSVGPRKGVFLRLAKTKPGVKDSSYIVGFAGGAPRTRRMLEGKAGSVGVAGRTLTDECGEGRWWTMVAFVPNAEELMEFVVEEVEEALEWVVTWWMLRMDETELEVDLRPRRPGVERRYEECGFKGAGEREERC